MSELSRRAARKNSIAGSGTEWPPSWNTLPHGISTGRYIDPRFMRLEYERLWSRVWQVAARLDEIPGAGDYTVYDIGDQSILVVRVDAENRQGLLQRLSASRHGVRQGDGDVPELPDHVPLPRLALESRRREPVRARAAGISQRSVARQRRRSQGGQGRAIRAASCSSTWIRTRSRSMISLRPYGTRSRGWPSATCTTTGGNRFPCRPTGKWRKRPSSRRSTCRRRIRSWKRAEPR